MRIPFWKYLGFALYLALYFIVIQGTWNYPPETLRSVLFKLLPLTQLIFAIMSTKLQHTSFPAYRSKIICGLVLSMVGDALLVWRFTLFIPGLLFFALAHICYINAFQLTPLGSAPTIVSCMIPAVASYLVILPGITEGASMCLMVALYSALLFTIVWRSIVYYQTCPGFGSFCACSGAIIFSVSDFLISYDKWRSPIAGAAFYVHATYFMAQMLIATSAVCHEDRARVKQD